MGNYSSVPSEEEVEAFCDNCRPLDLLVFQGAEPVSKLIRKLQKKQMGFGDISHVEVVITPKWCTEIKSLHKFEQFKNEAIKPHENYLLSWGSELSGKLNDGVYDAETGGVTFGVQIRDLKDLVRKYASNPKANVGICRLLNNPTETTTDPDKLKREITAAYLKYKDAKYDYNPFNLLAALYPQLRKYRKEVNKIIDKIRGHKKDRFLFCSEFAASLYVDVGVLNDESDGELDGDHPNPENVLPQDFLVGDQDEHGIKVAITEPPIWLKK
jgi:hypothetical protein